MATRTDRLIRMKSSGVCAHFGRITWSLFVISFSSSSARLNRLSFPLLNISGKEKNSGINSFTSEESRWQFCHDNGIEWKTRSAWSNFSPWKFEIERCERLLEKWKGIHRCILSDEAFAIYQSKKPVERRSSSRIMSTVMICRNNLRIPVMVSFDEECFSRRIQGTDRLQKCHELTHENLHYVSFTLDRSRYDAAEFRSNFSLS